MAMPYNWNQTGARQILNDEIQNDTDGVSVKRRYTH